MHVCFDQYFHCHRFRICLPTLSSSLSLSFNSPSFFFYSSIPLLFFFLLKTYLSVSTVNVSTQVLTYHAPKMANFKGKNLSGTEAKEKQTQWEESECRTGFRNRQDQPDSTCSSSRTATGAPGGLNQQQRGRNGSTNECHASSSLQHYRLAESG